MGVLSKESEDGGELIRSDATLVKRRERPSRKEVMDVEEAPLSPKASTSTFPNATEKLSKPIEQRVWHVWHQRDHTLKQRLLILHH